MTAIHPIDVASPHQQVIVAKPTSDLAECRSDFDAPFPQRTPDLRQRLKAQLTRLGWFFLFYTLSIGPMFWPWYEACYIGGSQFLIAFYGPLVWICDHCPPFGWLVNCYLNWWIL